MIEHGFSTNGKRFRGKSFYLLIKTCKFVLPTTTENEESNTMYFYIVVLNYF